MAIGKLGAGGRGFGKEGSTVLGRALNSVSYSALMRLEVPNVAFSSTNAVNTYYHRQEAEAPFTKVRIRFWNLQSAPVSGFKFIVAATETAARDTSSNSFFPISGGAAFNSIVTSGPGWRQGTFNGGSLTSGSAAAGNVVATYVESDWITLPSVPRADGGVRPLLLIRSFYDSTSGTNNSSVVGFSGSELVGDRNDIDWARVNDAGNINADGITNLASVPTAYWRTGGFALAPLMSIEFGYSVPSYMVLCGGDSFSAGIQSLGATDADGRDGWEQQFTLGVSTTDSPYTFMNAAYSGQTSATFMPQLTSILNSGVRPNLIVIPTISGNDGFATAQVNTYFGLVDTFITLCKSLSPRPKIAMFTSQTRNGNAALQDTARAYAASLAAARVSSGDLDYLVDINAQITNSYTRPDDLTNAAWNDISGTTITSNYDYAPITNAGKVAVRLQGTGAWVHGQTNSIPTAGTTSTINAWVKSNTGGNQKFRLFGNNGSSLSADLTATTAWQQFSFSFTEFGGSQGSGLTRDVANDSSDLQVYFPQYVTSPQNYPSADLLHPIAADNPIMGSLFRTLLRPSFGPFIGRPASQFTGQSFAQVGSNGIIRPSQASGSNPLTRTYQWYANGVAIVGATSLKSPTWVAGDIGKVITCVETVTANGSSQTSTAAIGTVTASSGNIINFTQTPDLSAAVGVAGGTLTGAQPDLFGGNGAVLFTESATNVQHILGMPNFVNFTIGVTYTQSLYVKAGTLTQVQLAFPTARFSGTAYGMFNTVGAVSNAGGLSAMKLEPCEELPGWLRCSATAVCSSGGTGLCNVGWDNNGVTFGRLPTYLGTGRTMTVFGWQLNAAAGPVAYVAT